jgi:hypothetical protein
MIALGFVFCTFVPPIPPEFDVGFVRQLARMKQRSRETENGLFTRSQITRQCAQEMMVER